MSGEPSCTGVNPIWWWPLIASGVTTVQHLYGRLPGKLDQVERSCDEAVRAYRDIGMRVSYSYAVRDQNRLVYQRDEDFVASLPAELRGPVQRWFERNVGRCSGGFTAGTGTPVG